MLLGLAWAVRTAALSAPTSLAASRPAVVVVPGFLYGSEDFVGLAEALRRRGVDATVAPIAWWHWIPCLGGRSVRPILERIQCAVDYASSADVVAVEAPAPAYSPLDLWRDFRQTPGGVMAVGGSADPDEFPDVAPCGGFGDAPPPRRACAIVGHSAAGWISRIFLSSRPYGGKAYGGSGGRVSKLVTLGSPHAASEGVAFANVAWANREAAPVPALAVAGGGFGGATAESFTTDSYAFCGAPDAETCDGDGVTPVASALDLPGAETLLLDGATLHAPQFPRWLAPQLHDAGVAGGTPWFGDDARLDAWAPFLTDA